MKELTYQWLPKPLNVTFLISVNLVLFYSVRNIDNGASVADPVRILHITDTHLHAHPDARMRGVNTFNTFQLIVERVLNGKRKPDAVIATGDLVQDETRQGYERFRDTIKIMNVPVHCLPGNHDSQRIMAETLNDAPFQYCGAAVYDDWCLIMLNTVVRFDDSGRLTPDELARLNRTLCEQSDKHVLIGMHHHPIPMGSLWLDGVNLCNSEKLFKALEPHENVRCMVWGHVHQSSDRQHNGIRMISTPSTTSQFLPDSDVFKMDTRPPGYRWLNLHPDGSIETEVVWL